MEELASTPDAKARNRLAADRLMKSLLQPKLSVAPAVPQQPAADSGDRHLGNGPEPAMAMFSPSAAR
jgi:hypothetical protein